MVFQLRYATAEAPFLFPAEIERHLKEIYDKAMRIAALREQTYPASGEPGLPVGDARSKACEEEGELVLWLLQDAKAESRKRFGKYLSLTPGELTQAEVFEMAKLGDIVNHPNLHCSGKQC